MAVRVPIGALRQLGTLSSPGAAASDGDGGFTRTYAPLNPAAWRFAIERATVRSVERQFAGTVIAQASYILTGRFHSGITTETRIVWVDRAGVTHTSNVLAVDDTEGAGVQTVVLVSEVVP
jgi:head-tail adaptor